MKSFIVNIRILRINLLVDLSSVLNSFENQLFLTCMGQTHIGRVISTGPPPGGAPFIVFIFPILPILPILLILLILLIELMPFKLLILVKLFILILLGGLIPVILGAGLEFKLGWWQF
jgi:hypothetical protein